MRQSRTRIALALYALALVLAYTLTGSLFHDAVEGLDRGRLPLWKLWLPFAVIVAASLTAFGPRRRAATDAARGGPTRRAVLRGLGATFATLGATVLGGVAAIARNRGWIPVGRDFFLTEVEKTAPVARPEWGAARIRSYRRLGRTGAMVSDVSLGSSRIQDVDIARRAFDRGLNYVDTAPDYADAGSEQLLGEAMRGRRREDLFVATKFCHPNGHLRDDTPVPDVIRAVEDSLRRLQTDYVDLVHIHSCDRLERLMAPNIHEAFDRLREQGKARFLGVSTHTPNLEEVANAAIDSRRFDVLMLAYHFGMWNRFDDILKKAKANDVAIVAMKTLKGAKHTNLASFRDEGTSYAQAAFRWVLSNPDVSCLVVSFSDPQHVDEYLAASGTAVAAADTALLERYDRLIAGDYCQPHCGACLDSCPHELPINDVLRYRMYARDYRWPEEGRRLYAALDRTPASCISCPAPCAGSCPLGVPIREKMLDARRVLKADPRCISGRDQTRA